MRRLAGLKTGALKLSTDGARLADETEDDRPEEVDETWELMLIVLGCRNSPEDAALRRGDELALVGLPPALAAAASAVAARMATRPGVRLLLTLDMADKFETLLLLRIMAGVRLAVGVVALADESLSLPLALPAVPRAKSRNAVCRFSSAAILFRTEGTTIGAPRKLWVLLLCERPPIFEGDSPAGEADGRSTAALAEPRRRATGF